MTRRYVILGNGIAGQTCAEDLRKADAEASITVIAAERHPLYNRVALPRYLRGQVRREKVFMRTAEDYEKKGIEIHFETWATDIDASDEIIQKADAVERVLVMGGSFIGYELAEGIRYRDKAAVTWVMRGPWF